MAAAQGAVTKSAFDRLAELGETLARAHTPLRRAPILAPRVADVPALAGAIARAARALRAPTTDPARQKASEWLLDNYYVCERALRQAKSEMPSGFRRHLPHAGKEPLPRVLAIARALVRATSLDLDEPALAAFVSAYQAVSPLTVAELWALPTLVRLAILEVLVQALDALLAKPGARAAGFDLPIEPGLAIERSIRALRLLAEIDWKEFFGKSSVVEGILEQDPAGVYRQADFATGDVCRKAVEEIAWWADKPEPDVARAAIALSAKHAIDPRLGHVGSHLMGPGRVAFEASLGDNPRPLGVRVRRAFEAHPTLAYAGVVLFATVVLLFPFAWVVALAAPSHWLLFGAVGLVPITSASIAIVHALLTRFTRPRTLPKLDFSKGIPAEFRTSVVIPALVAHAADVDELLRQLEVHYLSHPDPSLAFVLLIDHVDTPSKPDDAALVAHAQARLAALNAKYPHAGPAPFHILYRESRFNPAEGVFMAWERKRGKLEEYNRFLRGDTATSFAHVFGDPAGLAAIRFVITLDADTRLPLGAAQRLVGLMAHPLNRAVWDEESGRVTAGYTIVQPRVETSPLGGPSTWFSRMRAGDTAFDIYTRAVSDVYQDLFGAGIYVGKGIYDVDSFMKSLEGRVPENSLASHDLFEGSHGRAGLATDIVLFEEYPHNYLAFARRQHRWIRGDWQLLPWLLPRVPGARPNERLPNVLGAIDRWKIFDNLRRSLHAPTLLALVVAGLFALPAELAPLALAPLLLPLVVALFSLGSPGWREPLGRWALGVTSLPHDALNAADAIVRVLSRLRTRKHLLQWVSAAHTARSLRKGSGTAGFYREMGASVALVTAVAIGLVATGRFWAAAPLVLVWLLAPALLCRASTSDTKKIGIGSRDRLVLRRLARRTWLFFESFVVPGDQWLPPDNFQEEPRAAVAHRTSPTNIALLLIAEMSAHDFGYIGPTELCLLLRQSFDSLLRLERYGGHWLNWYATKSLEPLLPRYVSTVDSGNLAAAFISLANGCRGASRAPIVGARRWEGLIDTLGLLEEAADALATRKRTLAPAIAAFARTIEMGKNDAARTHAAILELATERLPELEKSTLALLDEPPGQARMSVLRELRTWLERLRRQVRGMRSDWDTFLAWVEVPQGDAAAGKGTLDPRTISLDDVIAAAEKGGAASSAAGEAARARRSDLRAIADRAQAETRAMDFAFLYDDKRRLFHIGYNVTSARLDPSYYDLLASEARVASFIAILLKQVPVSHWFALGRPVTTVHGKVALLSWGATMFEYLLPNVFMRSREHTLLSESAELAVEVQIDYGKKCGTPWGISESGFARLDAQDTYQYRSFGVPGLGLKRGLEKDLVIAPYASMLAVGIRPKEVMQNLEAFAKMGAIGTYGLYEACDYRSSGNDEALEEPRGDGGCEIVRSYMAHHQGMVLASLNNALHDDVLVERFHADALVHTGELLLNERLPPSDVAEEAAQTNVEPSEPPEVALPSYPAWSPDAGLVTPELTLLTNGRLTSVLTDSGAGTTRFEGLAVSPDLVDDTCDTAGTWIYIRDEESGELWSATPAPTRAREVADHVSFAPHKVEVHQRRSGISMRTEIAVAHLHDVEMRHVTLHNESERRRTLTLTSYVEPVLESAAGAARHPAFSRLFVECEEIADMHGVFCDRRRKAPEDRVLSLVHRAVWEHDAVKWVGSGTDRGAFIGRRRDLRLPAMVRAGTAPRRAPLDPAVTLALDVVLEPGATVEVAFVTSVARERDVAFDSARRFGTMHAVRWAIRDAERECARRLDAAGVAPSLLPTMARLVSRLLLPLPFYGAGRETRRRFSPSQPNMWGHGISGDDPLLVVRVREPEATTLVSEVLATYRYLRACGVSIEVVFLDQTASGYQAEEAGNVRSYLIRQGAAEFLHQRSGLFVLATDQLGPDETQRIEAAAQVLLDAPRGSLAEQWSRLPALPAPLPPFTAARAPTSNADAPLATKPLVFGHALGGFTEDGREYIVFPHARGGTPAPWCNVLANPELGCLVSESSLGSTWSVNAGENRLTPWRNDPVGDTPSEALYLRDEETAEVWSPTPLPAGLTAPVRVRHGAGYTVYEQTSHGLVQELTVFVAVDPSIKILRLRVKNLLDRPRRVTGTHYLEWALGTSRAGARSRVLCEFDADAQCVLARSAFDPQFEQRVAFVAADRALHGFTCDRTEFLGRAGSYARPAALSRWGLAGTTEPGIDPCAALQVHLDVGAGEEVTVCFALGQGKDRAAALELVRQFRAEGAVDAAWTRLGAHWDDLLGAVQVKTPEPAMDLMLNRWLLYESISSRFFARAAFYQSSGAYGFRDQLQDVMAFVHAAPAIARAHILLCAAHQFEEGDVLHWWHPPGDAGVRTRCSDDYLWLPFVTAHYVDATGDLGILGEEVPFLRAHPLDADEGDRYARFPKSDGTATLLEHCRRATARGYTHGAHGLPFIGSGDWNDGMNRVGAAGHGESVWLAWFLHAVTGAFVSLCEKAKSGDDLDEWRAKADRLRKAAEDTAWDGAWYVRAFDDDGEAIGTSRARSCRIDSIAQSWSVISGAADPTRAKTAMRSADENLVNEDDRLVLLLHPPFEGARHDPGYIQAYPPGVRENGGQYTHAAAWLGWAQARLGDGAAAERVFRLLNPILHAEGDDAVARYRVEPYVIAADVYDAKGCVGRGGWTWYTGAAAWTWRLGVEAILGITRVQGGFSIDPCIPPSWPGFEATVRVGTKLVRVHVENPDRVSGNVATMTLDGAPLPSHVVLIPTDTGPAEHEVRVVLGATGRAVDTPDTQPQRISSVAAG